METKSNAMTEIVYGGSITFLGVILSYAISFIYQVIAARYLGVEQFGVLSVGVMVMSVCLTISQLGLAQGAKKFVAFYISHKDNARVKGVLILTLGLTTAISVVLGTIIFLTSKALAVIILGTSTAVPVIRVFALALPFGTFIIVTNELFIAYKKPIYRIVTEAVSDKGIRVALLSVVVLAGGGLLIVSYAYLAAMVITAIIGYFLLHRLIDHKVSVKVEHRHIIYFSLPLFMAAIVGEVTRRIDKLLVGHFLGSVDLGVYIVAYTLAEMLTLGLTSLATLYYPIIVGLDGRMRFIGDIYSSLTRLSLIVTLPIFLFIIFFPGLILGRIYGEDYSSGALPLVIISSAHILTIMLGPSTATLEALGRTKRILYAGVISTPVNIILLIILTPKIGIIGTAISAFIALLLQHLVLFAEVKKIVGFKIMFKPYFGIFFSGFMAIILVYIITRVLIIQGIIALIATFLAFFILYFLFLLLFRAFREEDKIILNEILLRIRKSMQDKN
ncbi:MAG: flippase [Candidatus Woesearchaeota archaeon]